MGVRVYGGGRVYRGEGKVSGVWYRGGAVGDPGGRIYPGVRYLKVALGSVPIPTMVHLVLFVTQRSVARKFSVDRLRLTSIIPRWGFV